MTLDFTARKVEKLLEGNPGANIPALSGLLDSILKGYLPAHATKAITAAASLEEDTVFVEADLSGHVDFTIPQAANAPGKFFFAKNKTSATHNLVIKDDASSPATIATVAATQSALLWSNGTAWRLISIATV